MRLKRTLCDDFIMSNVSLIGICVKRDSTSKLISMSAQCNQIFWIFWMKSVELMMCVPNFPKEVLVPELKSVKNRMLESLYGANNWFERVVEFVYLWQTV